MSPRRLPKRPGGMAEHLALPDTPSFDSANSASCQHCGWRSAIVKQRCRACYEYLRRHGTDRPTHLVITHIDRIIEGHKR